MIAAKVLNFIRIQSTGASGMIHPLVLPEGGGGREVDLPAWLGGGGVGWAGHIPAWPGRGRVGVQGGSPTYLVGGRGRCPSHHEQNHTYK